MRKTCDARVEVLANGNPNVINYGFRPAIDAPKIPSKQDFLHDKRDKTSAEATEGRIVGFEAASGYAAIAMMQAGQPGDFFYPKRLGVERSGNKRFVVAGFGLIGRQTLVGLMRAS